MASLKAISNRIKSVNNIGKITSAMKMVSTAAFKHVERRMNAGVPFSTPTNKFFERLPEMDGSSLPNVKVVVLSADKGMCGGINSGLAKAARLYTIQEESKGASVDITCCGSKCPNGLKAFYGDRFKSNFEGFKLVPFNFTSASIVAESIINSDPDRCALVYNKFVSMIAYEATVVPMYTKKAVKAVAAAEWSKSVDQYNFEPPVFEVWDDLNEFYYATMIYRYYLESHVAEESARMAAMDNASKNSQEIVDKLTLKYNRARQAKITTELCEIIAGASAL